MIHASGMTDSPTTHFKGWAKPGPIPQGLPVPGEGETCDALSGHFRLLQLKDGHRFSTDDILTAWYGTTWAPTVRRGLDLGSGIGTVGMICAWRCPGATFVTVEAQEQSVALARRSAEANGLSDRYEIRLGDFRDPEVLADHEKFDLITGSPPYWPVEAGIVSEHPQKLACRFELRGSITDYCQTAARHLAPGGFFACVFPHEPQRCRRCRSGRPGYRSQTPHPIPRGRCPARGPVWHDARLRPSGMVPRANMGGATTHHPDQGRHHSSGIFRRETGHRISPVIPDSMPGCGAWSVCFLPSRS